MLKKSEILSILSPYSSRILIVHDEALKHFVDKYSEDRIVFCKRTMANMLRDLIVFYAKREFANLESEGVRAVERGNSFYIEFDGKSKGVDSLITARFKKVNGNLIASNIPTRAANAFNAQNQPHLSGIDWDGYVPTNVNFAHLPDDLRTTYEGVYVTQPDGNKAITWYATLSGENQTSQIVALPVSTQIETKARRVHPKAAQDIAAEKKKAQS